MRLILRCSALLLLLAAGCGKTEPAAEAWREKRAAAERRADESLKGFDQRLEKLRTFAESGAANAKEDVRRAMAELEEKKTTVQLKLEEIKTSTRENAHKAAENLDAAVDDLEQGVRDASSRFR